MRCRGAGHGPGTFRPPRSARAAAGRMRRVARRLEGLQRPARGAALRPQGGGLPQGVARHHRTGPARHHLLEFQSLRGAGRLCRPLRLPERSRERAAPGLSQGVRRRLHGRVPRVRADARVHRRRQSAPPVLQSRQPARRIARGHHAGGPVQPVPGDPGPDRAGVHQGLRRSDPDREHGTLADAAADRHGRHLGDAGPADLAAAILPGTPRGEGCTSAERPVLLAYAAPADRLLQPALRRRHRLPGRGERPRRATAQRPPGDQRGEPGHHHLLRAGDVLLRSRPRRHRDRSRHAQHRGAACRRPAAGGWQSPAADGSGPAGRRLDGRHPGDGDAEVERRGERLLRQVGGLPGALPGEQPVSGTLLQPAQRGAGPDHFAGHRGGPGRRRAAGDGRRTHGRGADRLPDPHGQLHAADREPGAVRGQPADDQGRSQPPRRRAAVPGGRALRAGKHRRCCRTPHRRSCRA